MIRDACAREGGDEIPSPRPLPVPSPGVPSVEQLRELADARIRARVAAAKQRRTQQETSRREFATNRTAGLRTRHALRQARLDLIAHHDQQDGDQQS